MVMLIEARMARIEMSTARSWRLVVGHGGSHESGDGEADLGLAALR
jgi:hypothetical protein